MSLRPRRDLALGRVERGVRALERSSEPTCELALERADERARAVADVARRRRGRHASSCALERDVGWTLDALIASHSSESPRARRTRRRARIECGARAVDHGSGVER